MTLTASNSYGTSAPFVVAMTVGPDQPPAVALIYPVDGTTVTGPISIPMSVNASSPDPDVFIAKVVYYNGSTKLGSSTTPENYNFTWKNVQPGTYTVTAVATDGVGMETTSAPATFTIVADQPPIVSIATPSDGTTYTAPATVALSANATSPNSVVESVTYYQGTTKIGTSNAVIPYAYTWKKVAAGTYTVTAVATDALGFSTTSAPIAIIVNP